MNAPQPAPGDICRSQPPHASPRLILITGHNTTACRSAGHPVVLARLLTNETEYATGTETFIPADHTLHPATRRPQRPYPLLAHEFPLYLNPRHLSAPLHRNVTTLPLNHPDVPVTCRSQLPPQPGSEPWHFKLAELDASRPHNLPLACLLGECPPHHDE